MTMVLSHVSTTEAFLIPSAVSTHMEPTPKMNIRPIFCLRGTCSFTTIGMGRIKRMTSEMMFAAAVAM